MRSFSPAVTSLLGLADVATFSMVSFGVSHFTSLPYDVELMGQSGTIYRTLGIDGGLVSIEPPRLSSDVDRAPYRIVIADPDSRALPLTISGYVPLPIGAVAEALPSDLASNVCDSGTTRLVSIVISFTL